MDWQALLRVTDRKVRLASRPARASGKVMTDRGPFTFTVAQDQVVRAMQRQMLRRLLAGPARWLLIVMIALLALLVVLDLLSTGRLSVGAIAVLIAVPLALAIVHFWLAPNLARRQFRQSVALRAVHTIAWDDKAVSFASERGNARLPFAEFHGWGDAGDVLMLYQTEMYFNLVPKEPLGAAAADLAACLDRAGVKRV